MAKSVKLSRTARMAAVIALFARLQAEAEAGSTAAAHKAADVVLRDMVNAEGVTYSGDFRCREAGREDARVKLADGTWANLEFKHGGGALAYADVCGMTEFTERTRDLLLQNADWVVYNIKPTEGFKRTTMALEYRVSTKEDFLDMLEEYCHGPRAKGIFTATKFSKEGTQINIQSKYLKEFWEGLQDDPRTMCLWDFCTDYLGRDPRWDW